MSEPRPFRLYVSYVDGEAPKAWAVRYNADGTTDVRWGRPDKLDESLNYPVRRRRELQLREKQLVTISGYTCQGLHLISAAGRSTRLASVPDQMECGVPAPLRMAMAPDEPVAQVSEDDGEREPELPSVYF